MVSDFEIDEEHVEITIPIDWNLAEEIYLHNAKKKQDLSASTQEDTHMTPLA